MPNQKSRILAQSQQLIERLGQRRKATAAFGAVSMLGMVAAFAIAPTSDDPTISLQTVVERLAVPAGAVVPAETPIFLREERIQRGDTLPALLSRMGVDDAAAMDFIRRDRIAQSISRQLRPGKAVTARTTGSGELRSLYFPVNGKDSLIVVERDGDRFTATEQAAALETRSVFRSAEIRYSLFGATDSAGIPDAVATQMADIFGGDIDFHRDLRKGDRFSVVYEMIYQRGLPLRSGRILAAEFTNNQKTYRAFWFGAEDGRGGYYGTDGKNLRKAFLRSPLEFSRVTSGFSSSRFHPVLQTWRAHRGVDYGAPSGTRVRSVADGTIEFAGRQGGYGNLVVIRHQGQYSTAYGHLNGFATSIRKGAHVGQGDIIGFVGQTGLASGPHLHYEFRVGGNQVNPLAVTLPTALPLESSQLPRFRAAIAPLLLQVELAREMNGSSALD